MPHFRGYSDTKGRVSFMYIGIFYSKRLTQCINMEDIQKFIKTFII
jgi:hypothetical protein